MPYQYDIKLNKGFVSVDVNPDGSIDNIARHDLVPAPNGAIPMQELSHRLMLDDIHEPDSVAKEVMLHFDPAQYDLEK